MTRHTGAPDRATAAARARVWITVALTPALAAIATAAPRVPAPELATVRALAGPLHAGRRAEAAVQYRLPDPLGGPARTVRGTVAVEAPDRVRLEFTTTGERITLRSDGGEWLQPAAKQLVRIPAARAAGALLWWRALLPASAALFHEDSLAPRRFRLTPRDEGAAAMHVTVALDPRGFPRDLAVEGAGDSTLVYRFSGWRFAAARGVSGYRLAAPPGYEVVDLP